MAEPRLRVERLAARLQCTEGQLYTVALAGMLAIVLAVSGLHGATEGLSEPAAAATGTATAPGTASSSAASPAVEPASSGGAAVERSSTDSALGLSVSSPSAWTPTDVPAPAAARVVALGWASASTGSLLSLLDDVPDNSLPVGARLGAVDKASFVRFDVPPANLELTVAASGQRLAENAAINACAITTEGWRSGDDMTFAAAPKWDAARCVSGSRDGTTWRFATGGLRSPNGVALVPAAGSVDFQVVFERAVRT